MFRLSHLAAIVHVPQDKKVEAPEPAAGRQTNATSLYEKKKAITTQAYLHGCIITICSIYRYTVHSEVRSLFISVPLADSLSHKHTVRIQTARI